jgi:hypothetical protein
MISAENTLGSSILDGNFPVINPRVSVDQLNRHLGGIGQHRRAGNGHCTDIATRHIDWAYRYGHLTVSSPSAEGRETASTMSLGAG